MVILEDLKAILRMRKRLKKESTALKNRIKKNLDRADEDEETQFSNNLGFPPSLLLCQAEGTVRKVS